jgi:hypothetical protein
MTPILLLLGLFATILLVAAIKDGYSSEIKAANKRYTQDIEKKTFQEMIEGLFEEKGRYGKEDFERAAKSSAEIISENRRISIELLNKMIEQIIWITGGALSLATTVVFSDKFHQIQYKFLFAESYLFLALSLIFALVSLLRRTNMHLHILDADEYSKAITEMLGDLSYLLAKGPLEETDRVRLKEKGENSWKSFLEYSQKVRESASISSSSFNLSIGFLAAAVVFIVALVFTQVALN